MEEKITRELQRLKCRPATFRSLLPARSFLPLLRLLLLVFVFLPLLLYLFLCSTSRAKKLTLRPSGAFESPSTAPSTTFRPLPPLRRCVSPRPLAANKRTRLKDTRQAYRHGKQEHFTTTILAECKTCLKGDRKNECPSVSPGSSALLLRHHCLPSPLFLPPRRLRGARKKVLS